MSTVTPQAPANTPEWDRLMPGPKMTLAEFHALPDDPQRERMLIRGRLWEKPMTKRTRKHARLESRIAHILLTWAEQQPEPRPQVYSGEIGCDLPGLESGVGIDVAVASAELEASLSDDDKYIIGAPTLAVEILSPTDRIEEINLKLRDYLDAGVPMVWIVNPFDETIVVHRPDIEPKLFTGRRELSADPILPGLHVNASDIFGT